MEETVDRFKQDLSLFIAVCNDEDRALGNLPQQHGVKGLRCRREPRNAQRLRTMQPLHDVLESGMAIEIKK